ncbi:MAG: glycosyltransferase family 39 protein [Chloroflexi bacterium]|nr:glycosyltransferase family 39 protein [Chloroflexota bacterium]
MPWSLNRPGLFLLVLAALTFGLLVVAADNPWLGQAGGIGLAVSRQSVPDILAIWALDADHPPLYYLALRYWTDLASTSGFVAKFPGIAAALLALPLAFQLGRRLGGAGFGLLTAYFVAISAYHVVHGVALRDYTLGVSLSIASLYTFARVLRPGAGPWAWAAYGACTLAALSTFYFALPVIAAEGLYLLLWPSQRRRFVPWMATITAVVIAYVPWLVMAVPPVLEKLQRRAPAAASSADRLPIDPQGGFLFLALRWLTSTDALGIQLWQVGLGVLMVGVPGWLLRRRSRASHGGLLLLGLVATLGFAYAGSRLFLKGEGGLERLAYTALPFYAPVAAFCLHAIARAHRLSLAVLLPLATLPFLASLELFLRPGQGRPERPLRTYLEQRASAQDLLLFTSAHQAGEFASAARDRWQWRLIPTSWEGADYPVVTDPERRTRVILERRGRRRALWLVLWDNAPLNNAVSEVLAAQAHPAGSTWLGTTYVAAYLWPGPLEPRPLGARFREGVELAHVAYDGRAAPGGAIRLTLEWRATGPLERRYRTFVHLVDARGQRRWSQHDGTPGGGRRPTTSWQSGVPVEDRHGLLVPTSMPPGEYWLDVGLSGGAQRLHLQAGGNSVRLGPVQVAPGPRRLP